MGDAAARNVGRAPRRGELEQAGVDPAPAAGRCASLHFVQIDEFYPIHPAQQNSFYYYVNKFYLEGFGLDPAKALLIDCAEIGLEPGETLGIGLARDARSISACGPASRQRRWRRPSSACCGGSTSGARNTKSASAALGGIGFFLGGIGPDGHIGFNIRGSDHYSTTRLMATNYETQAAAAGDLAASRSRGTGW